MTIVNALRAVAGELPVIVGRTVWTQLPLLLVVDLVVVVACVPGVLVALVWPMLAPLVFGAVLGPVWAGALSVAGALVRDEPWSVRNGLAGLKIGLVLGAVGAAAVGTLTLWNANPERTWLLVPLFVDGTVLALLAVASLSAFTLAESGLRGWNLWLSALRLAARRPVLTAGTLALAILAGLAVSWLPAIALVLPGPFAVFLAASVPRAGVVPELAVEERDGGRVQQHSDRG
ncbi:hypothetical protein [Tenggerimyces flavus]|uniref:DUF2189 domain-containing protein n=1 Tax=Tenggerimyces flavus TaxID=1708749 RepID=A0ABV7YA81_9ACTN|nr:hypothetical protein [Tenggerimyces flavus]MBM7785026.1 hypothetical protein [Tenggerimyces flavus]